MTSRAEIIGRLREKHHLSAGEYLALLKDEDRGTCELLRSEAAKAAEANFGKRIYIRGLIEISNNCRNNCLYCGLRAGNGKLERYRLSREEILDCCGKGYSLGFRSFVLQGGEDPAQDDEWVEDVVRAVRKRFGDCAITLSLGEKSPEAYRRFREAGADRYLLRHETINPEHYSRLHPENMSLARRLGCLSALKDAGYQTGSGIMVGSPFQTPENIVEDIMFIGKFRPEMIGIGPFIHHRDTPFADMPDGSAEMTCKLISIFRLMDPQALIPATTALASVSREGRRDGILAGANVVMPNLTPSTLRGNYSIYEGKASDGAESAEGLEELRKELKTIGYDIVIGRGDYKRNC